MWLSSHFIDRRAGGERAGVSVGLPQLLRGKLAVDRLISTIRTPLLGGVSRFLEISRHPFDGSLSGKTQGGTRFGNYRIRH